MISWLAVKVCCRAWSGRRRVARLVGAALGDTAEQRFLGPHSSWRCGSSKKSPRLGEPSSVMVIVSGK